MTTSTAQRLSRYDRAFARHRDENRGAFIPFTLLGWPNVDRCRETLRCMVDRGVSALELGLAFSDPVADGPIIQTAAFETLQSGFTVSQAWDLIREVRQWDADIPIGLLVYYNMVMARGVERFYQEAAAAGVDGILIADLPPEAAEEVIPIAEAAGIDPIFIISPLTDPARLARLAGLGRGFFYAVSRLGITGTEARYDEALQALITRAKAASNLPVCVGFGISSPEQGVAMRALGADGVVTGSAVVQRLREQPDAPVDTVLGPLFQAFVSALQEQSG